MRTLSALFIVLFAPACVFAADGVLEINQVCAAGDGCFPGDDAGFPVRIINSGSYILTSNLTVPENTDGITSRQADDQLPENLDISLNLNGFYISSTTVCTSQGADFECSNSNDPEGKGIHLAATGSGSFIIKNGTVRGMANTGVDCSSQCTIRNLHATQNAMGGIRVRGQILDSSAHVNGAFGISNNSEAGVTRGCRAVANDDFGIIGRGTLQNNAAFLNHGTGMVFNSATATGNRVLGNDFVTNTGVTCIDCVLRDNQISGDIGVTFVDSASLYGGNVIIGDTTDLANESNAVQDGVNLCSGSPCP